MHAIDVPIGDGVNQSTTVPLSEHIAAAHAAAQSVADKSSPGT